MNSSSIFDSKAHSGQLKKLKSAILWSAAMDCEHKSSLLVCKGWSLFYSNSQASCDVGNLSHTFQTHSDQASIYVLLKYENFKNKLHGSNQSLPIVKHLYSYHLFHGNNLKENVIRRINQSESLISLALKFPLFTFHDCDSGFSWTFIT